MTRQKTVIIVTALAIVFAVVAAGLMYNYLRKQEQVKAGRFQTIVVAAMEIPIGSKITDTMVKTAPWPNESVQPGSVTDPKALTAPGRITIKTIPAGEPITEHKLSPAGGTAGAGFMTYVVPPGHRAVTVAVNEVAGVAGFLTPDNKIDVVLTTPMPGNPSETISKIVLQNVPVLATGQIAQEAEGRQADRRADRYPGPDPGRRRKTGACGEQGFPAAPVAELLRSPPAAAGAPPSARC